MIGTIYKITNKVTGKIYVGQTIKKLSQRWHNHVYDAKNGYTSNRPLFRSILKYGVENFSIEKICETEDLSCLGDLEVFWIAKLNSLSPNGYNLTAGGDGLPGYEHTEETKSLMSLKHGGRKHTEETKQILREKGKGNKNALGHTVSEEAREKMSICNIGRVLSPEHRLKISIAGKGKKRSDITRSRISAAKMGNDYGKFNIGVKRSEQALANIRAGAKKRLANPLAGRVYGKRSEESKKRMSEAAKNRKRVYTEDERKQIAEKSRLAWLKRKATTPNQ